MKNAPRKSGRKKAPPFVVGEGSVSTPPSDGPILATYLRKKKKATFMVMEGDSGWQEIKRPEDLARVQKVKKTQPASKTSATSSGSKCRGPTSCKRANSPEKKLKPEFVLGRSVSELPSRGPIRARWVTKRANQNGEFFYVVLEGDKNWQRVPEADRKRIREIDEAGNEVTSNANMSKPSKKQDSKKRKDDHKSCQRVKGDSQVKGHEGFDGLDRDQSKDKEAPINDDVQEGAIIAQRMRLKGKKKEILQDGAWTTVLCHVESTTSCVCLKGVSSLGLSRP